MDSSAVNGCSNGDKSDGLWDEIEIPVPWGFVAGKWWGPRNKQPVLALHGWQDNAGTFDNLLPLLSPNLSILCIDLPGHGKSSHYPKGMQYYLFWDGVTLIRRIVKHFGWQKLTLMGHSLGGALSFMYAASFPDDVEKFISIDIAGPTVRDHRKTAASTGDSIDRFLKYETLPMSKMPCYEYEEMIDIVVDAYAGSVDRNGAKILMRRGMDSAPRSINSKGFHFVRDLRLKVSLLGMFSIEQVTSYAEQIKCDVLNIRAVPGMIFENVEVYPKILEHTRKNARRVKYEEVEGTHHIHLNTPERIYKLINEFLLETPQRVTTI
ncbi:putative serine hydrolase [Pseudolycoriella hygida]|uniref:Serine hydrolase n=1 Tax=Pseudolycoriella hygida TaxID=35572 RepID=A0A9Q0S9Y7_9DIPT|nr:putative serine hydrolase [Pseudolycoriella hygida]